MKPNIAFALFLAASTVGLSACGEKEGPAAPASPASAASSSAGDPVGLSNATAGTTGTISALSGTCPTLSFKLEGKIIRTVAATRYDGITCADIRNAVRLTVNGPTGADQSVQAEKVAPAPALPTPSPVPAPAPSPVAITGTVSAIEGTCPTLHFTLEGKRIHTTSATTYQGGACADVKNAIRMTATVATQSDGRILAQAIVILR